jgi:glycosyltransferase involved in cell wall biosynthesis
LAKVPKFKNYISSYITFAINQDESLYKKVFIEDIRIEFLSQNVDRPIADNILLSKPTVCTTGKIVNPIGHISIEKKNVTTLEEFDQLVRNNKALNKYWNHGFVNEKLKEMSESDARSHFVKLEKEEKVLVNKIILASTWDINCGIATYTKYLLSNLNTIAPNSFAINPINDGVLKYRNGGRLTHLQHEFGIVPEPLKIRGKLIVTWHTVLKRTDITIKEYESRYNVVAHIVHSEYIRRSMSNHKDVFAVPHGSMIIPEMSKEEARRLLGIDINMPIGFVFGFQSGDKNYGRLIGAAKNTNMHLMISGAPHNVATSIYLPNDKNVTFINRFLVENEVNLYALASDVLLFDYAAKDHFSVSGAMHRIIGAGRPVICSDVKHFNDVEHGQDCLKFRDQEGLEKCIMSALENSEKLSLAARNYAEKTSWEKIAKRHIDIYGKYTNI